ncbi:MAG: hypothetical protein HKO54_06170 [Flavobacteriaceae bacterium]|nr:hypothetical protein [Flavobacteriaceae bacterium]
MKQILSIFLYLYIYIPFSGSLLSQNIALHIEAEKELTQGLKDSLDIRSRFENEATLRLEADSLLQRFQRLGFLDVKLLSLRKRNDSVYGAKYRLGNRWDVLKLFYSETDFDPNELEEISNEVTSSYFVIPIYRSEEILNYLTLLKTEQGKPFAKLSLVNLTKDTNKQLNADLILTTGRVRTIDQLVIKGYEKFPRSYLRHYAGIKRGAVFNQRKVIEQNDLLDNLGFVQTVKAPEALFREDSTSVYFYLQKRNNNLFDGILGFATNEDTQKLEFNGYLNLELNNNLNYGEQLLINYKSDGRDQENFRVRASLPYLFQTPFGLSGELKIFKRDSTFSTTDQQVRVSYQLHPSAQIYAGYKAYESSNLLDSIVAGSTVMDFNSKYLLAGGSYVRQQRRNFFPIQTFVGLDAEIGNRSTNSGSEAQFRIHSTLNHIFNLNNRNSIYVNNSTSLLSSETYLTNELFRFGGINSIRGFSENSIDASLFSVLNTEYRYLLNNSIYLHSIIDLAYFENQTLNLKEELFSFGFGLGFGTEAGVFKLNFANGISGSENFKFSNSKIHISLSSRF